jgi:predicted nucleic acid-binding Zn ribbon protein
MPLWNYVCEHCGFEEERVIFSDSKKDIQCCSECDTEDFMTRQMAVPSVVVDYEGRTYEQLKVRSENHTRKMREEGYDPSKESGLSQSKREWNNKRRNKVTRKGLVKERADTWKKFQNKPKIEAIQGVKK